MVTSLIVAIAAVVIASFVLTLVATRHKRLLPGPPPAPILGNILQMRPRKIHQQVEKWAEDYGPLYEIWIFGDRVIVSEDPEVARLLSWERPDKFTRPAHMRKAFQSMKSDGLFSNEGELWKKHRRLMAPAFAKAAVNRMHHCISIPVERTVRKWQALVEESGSRGYAIMDDPRIVMSRLTFDVITYLALGYDINSVEDGDKELTKHLGAYFSSLDERIAPSMSRILSRIIPGWHRKFEISQKHVLSFINEIVLQTKQDVLEQGAEGAAKGRSYLLKEMILAQSDDESFTDEELIGNVTQIILGGLDTTSILLGWSIFLLCKYPGYHKKIRDEVLSIVGESAIPSVDQLSKLTMTTHFLQEALRLYGPAPVNGFEALEPYTINGHVFPAGTRYLILARRVWNQVIPDPTVFRPERWDDVNAKSDLATTFAATLPFGAGPRICPGRQLAMAEATTALAALVRSFDFELEGPEPEETINFVMQSTPFKVRVRAAKL